MSYEIDAWLEDGQPRLHIVDADSGHVRMAWQSSHSVTEADGTEVKRLFHDLMLLGMIGRMSTEAGPPH